ncbi:MAG TPA: hypothetical protein VF487_13405 [Chitinophagaceae bacterium]
MKITINDTVIDYIPDYPNGWKFSAGDPYKFPVQIAGKVCFVKRFQSKGPSDISGWDLLHTLKGRKETYLPTIYDIVEEMEGEKKITYVFYELIKGSTLEQTIFGGGVIRLQQTADQVLKALEAIHTYGFWFPDFCEKNIFCEAGGRVMLVDLDSAMPLNVAPTNEIYGSKDYWAPVYQFFKINLPQKPIMLSNLHGLSLNYLQSIFLVLHLKLHIAGKETLYKSDESFSKLPEVLGMLCPSSLSLFSEVGQLSSQPLSPQSLEGVKAIIKEIIASDLEQKPLTKPEILLFSSSMERPKKGELFTLSWKVKGANRLELYRNGFLLMEIDAAKNSIERAEFYDDDKNVRYQLCAYHNGAFSKSEEIVIRLANDTGSQVSSEVEGPLIPYIRSVASWSTFIAVTCLVIIGLMVIMAISLEGDYFAEALQAILIFFVVTGIFPMITLLRMSSFLKRGLQQADVIKINRGLRNLNYYFIYTAILLIILMLGSLVLVFANMAGA